VSPPEAEKNPDLISETALTALVAKIRRWGQELGFQQVGITDIDLREHEPHLLRWLQKGYHGDMHYMQRHGLKRARPAELVPGTVSVISVRMDYSSHAVTPYADVLKKPLKGAVSRYALGRDYHKLMRRRLQKLAEKIQAEIGPFGYRAFVDSAPVLEKALAEKAGLGWIGKHSNLINARAGSWFFLGEVLTDLPLPADKPHSFHCGSCRKCLDACPTDAIVAPFQVDARRCISYLTIENKGAIPEEFRRAMGNRIYGCDDCQMVCPWNKFAHDTRESDFLPRHRLDTPDLVELFAWDEPTFLKNTEGSAIRRIGHAAWLRNIAVALGNAPSTPEVIAALEGRQQHPSALVREHVQWALRQHTAGAPGL
jgi:epoxyqueuosine reductase